MSRFPLRLRIASTIVAIVFMASASYAQDERGGGRGERGGDRGGGGGEGFRGGGPEGGGGFRGGPPGGGGFRGGPPGGSGFSPADMLRRFDQNGNGMIDPAEAQGPASFFLQRIASAVPGIDLAKPIPIDKLSQAMDRMRQERESGGGDSTSGRSSSRSTTTTIEPLVPGFGVEDLLPPALGFGATAELFTIKTTDADKREAEERFRRYDSNGDGILDKAELARGRWSEDPLTYDRNHDGKLTLSEMAVRYAQRRVAEEASRSTQTASRSSGGSQDSRGGDRASRGGFGGGFGGGGEDPRSFFSRRDGGGGDASSASSGSTTSSKAATDSRTSYRVKTVTERLPKGLPDWFARSDANIDGQVAMSEFATSWSDSTLKEFSQFDLNHDGFITAKEALEAVNNGVVRGSSSSTMASSTTSAGPVTSSPSSGVVPNLDPKYVAYYQKLLAKYDTNGDGALVADEWKSMSKDPSAADTDGDGRIVVNELTIWSMKR
ncbi:MAG: EF-hand domain-containing protein [Planctomycetaceae bacterium]|nr:hypothetical protein [Planctomycetales bacterium]MCB9938091.1 EF-hand domain-containing protein [Planctomycetaceae bacterium]